MLFSLMTRSSFLQVNPPYHRCGVGYFSSTKLHSLQSYFRSQTTASALNGNLTNIAVIGSIPRVQVRHCFRDNPRKANWTLICSVPAAWSGGLTFHSIGYLCCAAGRLTGRHGARSPQRPGRQYRKSALNAGPQAEGNGVLSRLLSFQSHLGSHDPLSLGDQIALGTGTVLEATVSLMSLQPGHHTMVPASCTLGLPSALLSERVDRGNIGVHLHHDGSLRCAGLKTMGSKCSRLTSPAYLSTPRTKVTGALTE